LSYKDALMKPDPKILVIEDEPQIVRALRTILQARRFQVLAARDGETGLALAAAQLPDIILLDLGLPDMDGTEVCRKLREWTQIPIIILSVRDSEQDKVAALELGADDYLTKPFGIEELIARLGVALRHSAQAGLFSAEPVIGSAALQINFAQHRVTRYGIEVRLTATEFRLLTYMANNAGRMLSHHTIMERVWGPENSDRVEYLRVYIHQLRIKLETDPEHPKHIVNEPGIGYRFFLEP